MKNLSFAGRILLVAFVPALLVGILMSLYLIVHSIRDGEISELGRATTLAKGLSRAAEFGVATNNRIILDEAAGPVLDVASIFAVRYYAAGDTLIHEIEDPMHQHANISRFATFARYLFSSEDLISRVSAVIQRTDLTLYRDPLFDTLEAAVPDVSIDTVGRVELEVDLSQAYQEQYDTIKQAFLFVGLVLIIALAAAYRLAQSVVVPVRALTSSVQSLARNEYVRVQPVNIGGELDELARGINFLSSELQSFHAQQSDAIALATGDLQKTLTLLEAKNAELEQAREAAETASAFKSQFVANVSHELRTPLNAIIGTLSVMNKTGLDITQVDQFDMIESSSNTLLYLIEDILDISRIESGNLVVESIHTNLEKLLAEVTGSAAMQAVDRGIELYVSPIPDLSLRDAYTDPVRLKQVLSNLLANAIKFTHSGHVSLTTELIASHARRREVRFTVEDTGIGIPRDKQKSLFSAFTQADMSTTRRYGGTGLGLYISQGIISLLGGTIEMKSTEGKGSLLTVTLTLTVPTSDEQRLPADGVDSCALAYADSYAPLEDANHKLACLAFSHALATDKTLGAKTVRVSNIPNHHLTNSWAGPAELDRVRTEKDDAHGAHHIAWISLITPLISHRLKQAGYTGYVVKTPSLIQLERQVQVALSGQCFDTRQTGARSEHKPDRLLPSLTVLAVDDQRINIDLLMQYFDYLDIRGIYAASGEEALSYVETEVIDLVLLDLHMPEQDGFNVAERIRTGGSINAQIPIIAMTADAYQTTRERALSAGFDDVLIKPATVQQVSDAIWHWTRLDTSNQAPPNGSISLIDVQACARAVRGDEAWARQALKTYASEIPGHLNNLRDALKARDSVALFDSAHALKGVSRLFQIHPIANTAETLEKQCNNTDWKNATLSVRELERLLRLAENECTTLQI